ncbi:MAG: SDR family oxidoreductase [Saprospiraceae bacterium]
MNNILLTGATGFLGKVILELLTIKFPKANIYCLARSQDDLTAKERIKAIKDSEKINTIEGDITMERLAMSNNDYQYCRNNIDVIIHSAASTKFNAPVEYLESHNITATKELIILAERIKETSNVTPFFIYVSTAYQAGKSNNLVEEKFTDQPILGFKNNYEESKWLSEQLIKSRLGSCQFAIVRPSIIMAHESGKCSADGVGIAVFGLLHKRSKTLPSPIPITKKLFLDLVTVDYVAQSIVDIVKYKDSILSGTIFHLTDVNGGMSGKSGIKLSNKLFGTKFFGVNTDVVKTVVKFLVKYTKFISYRDQKVLTAYLDYFGVNPTFETKKLSLILDKKVDTLKSKEVYQRAVKYWIANIYQEKA